MDRYGDSKDTVQDLNAPRPLVKDLSLKDKRSPTEARGEFFFKYKNCICVYIQSAIVQ